MFSSIIEKLRNVCSTVVYNFATLRTFPLDTCWQSKGRNEIVETFEMTLCRHQKSPIRIRNFKDFTKNCCDGDSAV